MITARAGDPVGSLTSRADRGAGEITFPPERGCARSAAPPGTGGSPSPHPEQDRSPPTRYSSTAFGPRHDWVLLIARDWAPETRHSYYVSIRALDAAR